ncbi:MAG: hypothetical protein ACNI26_15670 [Terasakiella sp.]|uniref:hypothetical protein n=1 Tax=unclassified Terasakiella TaxID=2614952 RepID=UPI003B0082D1
MRTKSKAPASKVVQDIRHKTRKQHSAEEKIHIVLEGFALEEADDITSYGGWRNYVIN